MTPSPESVKQLQNAAFRSYTAYTTWLSSPKDDMATLENLKKAMQALLLAWEGTQPKE